MRPKTLYLALCVAGTALPYSEFLPFLREHGLDLRLFFELLFANPGARHESRRQPGGRRRLGDPSFRGVGGHRRADGRPLPPGPPGRGGRSGLRHRRALGDWERD